mmetsp:Transcript_9246/g.18195  ORF Transcript_9246/g.18195 Transcript_9246/m.18195 type:complete len:86 (+) Transcript_9246:2847-3104(+)
MWKPEEYQRALLGSASAPTICNGTIRPGSLRSRIPRPQVLNTVCMNVCMYPRYQKASKQSSFASQHQTIIELDAAIDFFVDAYFC